MRYSIVIPVYNRPAEVDELLNSLAQQTFHDFEIIVVDDGSTLTCEDIVRKHGGTLSIHYYYKPNTGPGGSRNFGAARAIGDYIIVMDSDCIAPSAYLQAIESELALPCDAFGGPDSAHPSFSAMQKAVNYAMTSFFTTGGIRGGTRRTERFHPRSFNMGIRRTIYEQLHGFSDMRYGEDIDFSIRLFDAGCEVRLFPAAFVYHKRRENLRKFFAQVRHSGSARIILRRKYPASLRVVHLLPAAFTLGCAVLIALAAITPCALLPLLLFCLIVFTDSSRKNHSMCVGFLSILTAFTQLFGYGIGFLCEIMRTTPASIRR